MTQEDLDKLAEHYENNIDGITLCAAHDFKQGFKKALESVSELLLNSEHTTIKSMIEFTKEYATLL